MSDVKLDISANFIDQSFSSYSSSTTFVFPDENKN